MQITDAEDPTTGLRYRSLPGGQVIGREELEGLEQMIDQGDAHLEEFPSGSFTHRLVVHQPMAPFWRVRVVDLLEDLR